MDGQRALASVVKIAEEVHRGATTQGILDLIAAEVALLLGAPVTFAESNGTEGTFSIAMRTDAPVPAVVRVDGNGFTDDQRRGAEQVLAAGGAALTATHARELSRVDHVTRVLSRAALRQALDEEVERSRRAGTPLACAVFDLDGFKAVNDELGHLAGDDVLREVGAALSACARPYDRVGRLGGDEFVALMPNTDAESAQAVAERLRSRVSERAGRVAGRPIGCSAGFAMLGAEPGPDVLLDAADQGLRAAKRTGRARTVSGPAPSDEVRVVADGSDLERVLGGEGVRTLFQPIQALADDAVVGFEALTRGPGRLERPDVLLAEARAAGRLVDVDERLRAASFAAARDGGLRAPASLFVNIEPETLLAIADDAGLWRREDLPFPSLTEITERSLFERPGELLRAVHALRARGWGVALDDLGSDPRALALLALIAPDVIKLDLRMLRERPAAELADMTTAVSAQVQHGGAVLLAEGIEGEEHAETALALGATFGQGWLFGRPAALTCTEAQSMPVRRTIDAAPIRGVTPFGLLASRAAVRRMDEALLAELQATLERRALSVGGIGAFATLAPSRLGDNGIGSRFEHLSSEMGVAQLLDGDAFDPGDPFGEEWVSVLACSEFGVAFAARPAPGRDRRWDVALVHDRGASRHVAEQLLVAAGSAATRD